MPNPGITQFDPQNPTTPDDAVTMPSPVNEAVANLNGILSADTQGNQPGQILRLRDASILPTAGWVSIDSEIIEYNGKSSNDLLNIIRAAQGSPLQSHTDQAVVFFNFTAAHLQVLITAVINLQSMFSRQKFDTGVTDGSNPVLTSQPVTGQKVLFWVDGMFQLDGVDFNVVGSTLDFGGSPPPATFNYLAYYIGQS